MMVGLRRHLTFKVGETECRLAVIEIKGKSVGSGQDQIIGDLLCKCCGHVVASGRALVFMPILGNQTFTRSTRKLNIKYVIYPSETPIYKTCIIDSDINFVLADMECIALKSRCGYRP